MKEVLISTAPITQSELISTSEEIVTRILVSYGGGMGGANRTYYAKKLDKKGDFYKATLIDGVVEEINPAFIVSIKKQRMVTVVINSSNKNYLGKVRDIWFMEANEKPKYVGEHGNTVKDKTTGKLHSRTVLG